MICSGMVSTLCQSSPRFDKRFCCRDPYAISLLNQAEIGQAQVLGSRKRRLLRIRNTVESARMAKAGSLESAIWAVFQAFKLSSPRTWIHCHPPAVAGQDFSCIDTSCIGDFFIWPLKGEGQIFVPRTRAGGTSRPNFFQLSLPSFLVLPHLSTSFVR